MIQGNQEKYTLLYGRLSDEDDRAGTSRSIENQEEILRKYAADHGFTNPLFLYDDGVSGTKTDRPEFQRALELVKNGQVSVFIVTDLSRLFRNQAEANKLMEVVLPALGVRFISINDHYDSATNTPSDEDLAMFLNLFNEYYPRQTSRKVNAVIQAKAKNGVRIASIPPYGYKKDPQDNRKIVVDPEAAEIVRRIYALCISGLGPEQIAKRFKREQVLVPAEYAYRKFGRDHATRNPDRPYDWSDGTVARILENEDYVGTQISCKTHKPSYKSDLVVPVPEEQRYRVEHAHEPIVSREDWEIVQEIRTHKRRPTKLGEMDLLSGLVYCADCGHIHHLSRSGQWDESKYTYVCGTYHGHKESCTPHTIKALHLRQLVLAAIRIVIAAAKVDREAFVAHLLSKQAREAQSGLAAKRRELTRMRERLAELDRLIATAFEKLAGGVITDEAFQVLDARFTDEKATLAAAIPTLEGELEKTQEDLDGAAKFCAIVDRYLEVPELSPEIVREFVSRIVVHERSERWKKKFYTQDVDVFFRYIGKIHLGELETYE